MNRRMIKRLKTHHLAKVCGNTGVVNNVSQGGLLVSTAYLPSKKLVDIVFELEGEKISVKGVVKWFRRKNALQTLNRFGIAIKEAPSNYYNYIRKMGSY